MPCDRGTCIEGVLQLAIDRGRTSCVSSFDLRFHNSAGQCTNCRTLLTWLVFDTIGRFDTLGKSLESGQRVPAATVHGNGMDSGQFAADQVNAWKMGFPVRSVCLVSV